MPSDSSVNFLCLSYFDLQDGKKKNLDAEATNSNPTLNALFVHFGLEGRKSRLYLLKQVMGRVILLGCN